MRKTIPGGARQAKGWCCFELISSHQQGIHNSLSSTPPVYIHKAHQNTSGSAVAELMRFIHHIITYIVPAMPRAINWARSLTQKPPVMYMYMYTYHGRLRHVHGERCE